MVPSFSLENRCSLPILSSLTMRNVLPVGKLETGQFRDSRCRPGDRLGDPMSFLIPPHFPDQFLLRLRTQVTALFLELVQELVVDGLMDDEVSVRRTAGAVVVGLAEAGVPGRLLDIRRFIDHHGRISRSHADRPACPSCRRTSPSARRPSRPSNRKWTSIPAPAECSAVDGLCRQILGCARLLERLAHQTDDLS